MDAPSREERLAEITRATGEINEAKTALTTLYEARGDLFLSIIEADPECPVKAMADAAGNITGPAVSQQIDKARDRRAKRAAEQKALADAQSEPVAT